MLIKSNMSIEKSTSLDLMAQFQDIPNHDYNESDGNTKLKITNGKFMKREIKMKLKK